MKLDKYIEQMKCKCGLDLSKFEYDYTKESLTEQIKEKIKEMKKHKKNCRLNKLNT